MPDPDPEEAHRVRLAIAANLAGLSAATEHVSRSVAEVSTAVRFTRKIVMWRLLTDCILIPLILFGLGFVTAGYVRLRDLRLLIERLAGERT